MRSLRLSLLLCSVALAGAVNAAFGQTVSIAGLYATGVDNGGVALAGDGVLDNHYVVTANTAGNSQYGGISYTIKTTAGGVLPGWVSNSSTSRWIIDPRPGSQDGSSNRPSGTFDYTISFDLPVGSILSTVAIAGAGAAEDSATIFVNGTLVSSESIAFSSSLSSFSLNSANSAFVNGTNSITFRVNNLANNSATGLLITSLSGTTAVVPEVGTFLPIAGALALFAFVRVSRNRRAMA